MHIVQLQKNTPMQCHEYIPAQLTGQEKDIENLCFDMVQSNKKSSTETKGSSKFWNFKVMSDFDFRQFL